MTASSLWLKFDWGLLYDCRCNSSIAVLVVLLTQRQNKKANNTTARLDQRKDNDKKTHQKQEQRCWDTNSLPIDWPEKEEVSWVCLLFQESWTSGLQSHSRCWVVFEDTQDQDDGLTLLPSNEQGLLEAWTSVCQLEEMHMESLCVKESILETRCHKHTKKVIT